MKRRRQHRCGCVGGLATGERTWHRGLDERHDCRPITGDCDRLLIGPLPARDEVLRVCGTQQRVGRSGQLAVARATLGRPRMLNDERLLGYDSAVRLKQWRGVSGWVVWRGLCLGGEGRARGVRGVAAACPSLLGTLWQQRRSETSAKFLPDQMLRACCQSRLNYSESAATPVTLAIEMRTPRPLPGPERPRLARRCLAQRGGPRGRPASQPARRRPPASPAGAEWPLVRASSSPASALRAARRRAASGVLPIPPARTAANLRGKRWSSACFGVFPAVVGNSTTLPASP